MIPATAYVPPDGPRWLPPRAAAPGTRQTDGRGITWLLERVEQGGRVLHWRTTWDDSNPRAMLPGGNNIRRATTTATPDHPDYPSDAAVLAAARAARAAERERRATGRYYP